MLNNPEKTFSFSINKNIVYFILFTLFCVLYFLLIVSFFETLEEKINIIQEELKSLTAAKQDLNNLASSKNPLLGENQDSPKMSEEYKTFLVKTGFLCAGVIVLCAAFFYFGSSLKNKLLLISSYADSSFKYLGSFFYEDVLVSNQSVDSLGNILKHQTDIKTGTIEYFIKPVNKTEFEPFSLFLAEHPHYAQQSAHDFETFASDYIACSEKLSQSIVENPNSAELGLSIADTFNSGF